MPTKPATRFLADAWVGEVLRFWFDDLVPEQWFAKNADLDRRITARFAGLHAGLTARIPSECWQSPDANLAGVIVLDQMSRNMFRGSPKSFASDPAALMLASAGIASGHDLGFGPERRCFLYLPFEHAESLAVQERSVTLFTSLGNANWSDYAVRHRDVIARFGRFPHRNEVLGRSSTPEELAFLREPGSSF